ncbi:3804_t:CDS:2, partial [Entrophospora sp. SA101]
MAKEFKTNVNNSEFINTEKILDLKKYFVFNLGKEVKTCQQAETKSENVHSISTSLSSDQSKRIQTNNWN